MSLIAGKVSPVLRQAICSILSFDLSKITPLNILIQRLPHTGPQNGVPQVFLDEFLALCEAKKSREEGQTHLNRVGHSL